MSNNELVNRYISEHSDWKGEILAQLRSSIHEADPQITEEWKWDVPVFTHNGMICAISSFKNHVKINFFKGALLKDPHNIINAGLESKQHRSIDFHEGGQIPKNELIDLIKEAVSLNSKT